MAFIGNQPALSYTSFAKQDFTTSATISYTLDNPVANANELALFINFVRQEPTTAYSASGTTLTLTSATSATDDMYCVFLGKAVQTVNPPNASVGSSQLSPIAITGQTAETSIATDDTILIHDTSASALRKMTRANFVSGIGGTNTPACSVYLSSSQNISNNTWTKITFDSEIYDTNNAFASNKFTVPSGQGGTYNFNTRIKISGIDDTEFIDSVLHKNGSAVWNTAKKEYNGGQTDQQIASIVTNQFVLSAGDYIEFYAMHNEGSTRPAMGGATDGTWMHIYKLIT